MTVSDKKRSAKKYEKTNNLQANKLQTNMIITISGSPGSGKSTVGKKLTKKLGYQRHYVGGIRRGLAKAKGMTLAEFNKWSETHPKEGDIIIDQKVKRLGRQYKNLIVEGRTAFHFIPHSLKIYLYIDLKAGAKRIWSTYQRDKDKRNEDDISSLKDLVASLKKRDAGDKARYKKLYNLNIAKKSNYDLWLDVTKLNKKQEFDAVYQFIKKHFKKT